MSRDLSPQETTRLHMMKLFLRLPGAGVTSTWPTEDACRERLVATRWPEGATCPKCNSAQIGLLEARQVYHCKSCHLQFTPKSHSTLHHSRVKLQNWFRGAELLIWHNANHPDWNYPTGHDLKDELGISYAAAYSLKKKLSKELSQADGGLVGRCILVGEPISPPADIPKDSIAEFFWFFDQMNSRT